MNWPTCAEALCIPFVDLDVACERPRHHEMDGEPWHLDHDGTTRVLWRRTITATADKIEIMIGDCRGFDPGPQPLEAGRSLAGDPEHGD